MIISAWSKNTRRFGETPLLDNPAPNLPMIIHDEVAVALKENKAVVALESTVIAHGLPYPDNLAIAKELDHAVRREGAIPAMIALMDGFIRVGLNNLALEQLADPRAMAKKVSRRDLAYTLGSKSLGATTVSATMLLAHLARIKIFATGGIGGVHRGGERSMDISADLYELGSTPVAVVCAGAKSILDVAKTLEVLETLGVAVWGFETKRFPEFFCLGARYELDMHFDCVNNLATALNIHWDLGLKTGVVIAQAVPETFALDQNIIEAVIQEATSEAHDAHVQGKALTPYLLGKIAQKSQGQSLIANRALLIENARLAARIAVCS